MVNKGWQKVLLIIIPYFFCLGLFQLMGYIVADVPLESIELKHKTLFQTSIIAFFTLIGTLFIVLLFVMAIDKEKFQVIGLSPVKWGYDILLAFLLSVALLSISFVILLLTDNIRVDAFSFSLKNLLLTLLLFIFVSVSEELFFRAYILRNLMGSMNKYTALIVSSVFFALMHAINPNINFLAFVSLFVAGGALGISYIYTRSLWFPISLHFSWNFLQSQFGFNVSGQKIYSILEISFEKANYLNGGDFGFEGSILSIIAGMVIIVWGIYYFSKRERTNNLKTNIE